MSGEDPRLPDPADPSRIRAVVPEGYLMAKMDPHVRDSFNAALAVLDAVGMPIRRERLDVIDQVPGVSSKGGFAAAEAYHYHRRYIADYKECYDPRVLDRIAAGERISACDYQDIVTLRRVLQRGWEDDGRFEVMLLPATPITARPLAALAADEDFTAVNNLYLRNTSVANVLDCPSISIPCHKEGEAPVGLMMIGKMGQDRRLFGLAKAVEKVLNRTCR
jgi:aspartyl-tRNA(Asn)/glutamyl-tRNA(Gln) amidotransferase subunit A